MTMGWVSIVDDSGVKNLRDSVNIGPPGVYLAPIWERFVHINNVQAAS